jgi:hypothetical protein
LYGMCRLCRFRIARSGGGGGAHVSRVRRLSRVRQLSAILRVEHPEPEDDGEGQAKLAASGACDRKALEGPRSRATRAFRQRSERACQASRAVHPFCELLLAGGGVSPLPGRRAAGLSGGAQAVRREGKKRTVDLLGPRLPTPSVRLSIHRLPCTPGVR